MLRQLPPIVHPAVIVGTDTSDDAGVFRLGPDLAIVNTVDFFTPIVDDPYVFGQIAAANALSDVYAMGGDPITALNIVGFPKGQMDVEILADILKGGIERATEAGAVVIGGHTIIDPELKYGMAVTGVIHPERVLRNVGVREGDALVLTKPLGTGIVTTALKQRKASPAHVRAAVRSMVTLNKTASRIARTFRVHACSDVTGFGLARPCRGDGHGQRREPDARLGQAPDPPRRREAGRPWIPDGRVQAQSRLPGGQGHRGSRGQAGARRDRVRPPDLRRPAPGARAAGRRPAGDDGCGAAGVAAAAIVGPGHEKDATRGSI